MNSTSNDAAPSQRPPTTLLVASLSIFFSFLLSGAEWWSDRRGYDRTIATLIVPQTRYPVLDVPIQADGSTLQNPVDVLQSQAASEAGNRRYDIRTTGNGISIVLIGVMFVAGFGCGLVAWNRMRGRRWSRGAAMLCILCRNALALTMVVICAALACVEPTTLSLLVAAPVFALSFLVMAQSYARSYRTLRAPRSNTEPEIPLSIQWQAILAATVVTSSALFVGGNSWLADKQQEQREESDRLSAESATIAKAFADESMKSGAAKYPNRKACKQAHPFDRRYNDSPF